MADCQTTQQRHVCEDCGHVQYAIVPDECECRNDRDGDGNDAVEKDGSTELMRELFPWARKRKMK